MSKARKCTLRYCKAQYIKFERLIDKEAKKPKQERDSDLLREYIETAEMYKKACISMQAERKEKKAFQPGKAVTVLCTCIALIFVCSLVTEATGLCRVWSALLYKDARYLSMSFRPKKSNGGVRTSANDMALFNQYHCSDIQSAETESGIRIPIPYDIGEVESVELFVVVNALNTSDVYNTAAEIHTKTFDLSVFTYTKEEEFLYAKSAAITGDFTESTIGGTDCFVQEKGDYVCIVLFGDMTLYKLYSESNKTAVYEAAERIAENR